MNLVIYNYLSVRVVEYVQCSTNDKSKILFLRLLNVVYFLIATNLLKHILRL